jgi:hypothetical protein
MIERSVLELAGIALIVAASVIVANLYSTSPLNSSLSRSSNAIYFVCIPLFTYVGSRIYLGIVYSLLQGLSTRFLWVARSIIVTSLIACIALIVEIVPDAKKAFHLLYSEVNRHINDLLKTKANFQRITVCHSPSSDSRSPILSVLFPLQETVKLKRRRQCF